MFLIAALFASAALVAGALGIWLAGRPAVHSGLGRSVGKLLVDLSAISVGAFVAIKVMDRLRTSSLGRIAATAVVLAPGVAFGVGGAILHFKTTSSWLKQLSKSMMLIGAAFLAVYAANFTVERMDAAPSK